MLNKKEWAEQASKTILGFEETLSQRPIVLPLMAGECESCRVSIVAALVIAGLLHCHRLFLAWCLQWRRISCCGLRSRW